MAKKKVTNVMWQIKSSRPNFILYYFYNFLSLNCLYLETYNYTSHFRIISQIAFIIH